MLLLSHLTRPGSQPLPQFLITNQLQYRRPQPFNIARLDEQRRLTIDKHLTNLAQSTRDNPLTHRHVLKNLRRRSKELAAIRERNMRRNQYVANIKQLRHALVGHSSGKNHTCLILEQPLNLRMQAPASHQKKEDAHIRRNCLNRLGKFLNSMPRTKRPDKPGDHLIVFNPKFAAYIRATNAGPKALDINAIRVHDDLLPINTTAFEIAALNFRDDKNTRRSVKVQTLITLQQIETSNPVPMLANPDFRAVVL